MKNKSKIILTRFVAAQDHDEFTGKEEDVRIQEEDEEEDVIIQKENEKMSEKRMKKEDESTDEEEDYSASEKVFF
jgi:hypothetical protein